MARYHHGTKVPPEVVEREGLRPAPIRDILAAIAERYGVPVDVVERLGRNDIRRKREHLAVYFTEDWFEALSYAERGSNFENLVAIDVCRFLGIPFEVSTERPGYVYTIEHEGVDGELRLAEVRMEEILRITEVKRIGA